MHFNDYRKKAWETSTPPAKDMNYSLLYSAVGVCGEAGELAEKIKKVYRDNGGKIDSGDVLIGIAKEIGDVLWYLANICSLLSLNFDEVAKMNIDKLQSRADRGLIGGNGDER